MDIVEKARVFSIAAHSAVKQTRKYTNEPYWVHTNSVAATVADVTGATEQMIAAAHLHDTVEDTGITIADIHREFGAVVASYVHWLTDQATCRDGNRAKRKALDRERIRNAPVEVKTIKLADIIDNASSIGQHDAKFAEVYFEEKRQMLTVLQEGDAVLFARAQKILGT